MKSEHSILIVDDEPNILTALEFLLQREGYQVWKATNGLEAIEQLQALHPTLVILDVMMPGMGGFEVAHHIRTTPSLEKTQIIFLTAKGTQQDKMKGYDNGGEYYIVKPFDNDAFVTIVNEAIAFA